MPIQPYRVQWGIRHPRGGYRDEGEDMVNASSAEDAQAQVRRRLWESGMFDYPSELVFLAVEPVNTPD